MLDSVGKYIQMAIGTNAAAAAVETERKTATARTKFCRTPTTTHVVWFKITFCCFPSGGSTKLFIHRLSFWGGKQRNKKDFVCDARGGGGGGGGGGGWKWIRWACGIRLRVRVDVENCRLSTVPTLPTYNLFPRVRYLTFFVFYLGDAVDLVAWLRSYVEVHAA